MRLRRRLMLMLLALLGAAVVVLPAVAGSETTPTVTAVNTEDVYKAQHHYWSPSTVVLGSGGVVTFSNPSTAVSHGLEWTAGPATPSCSGLPGSLGGTSWHGECAFTQAGTYTFRCTVHPTEMTGTVTVSAAGTTTTTTTTTAPAGGGGPTGGPTGSSESPQPMSGLAGSPLAGSASQAVRLASSQRGQSVRGSVSVSTVGSGGRLQVDLLAKAASLAGHRKLAQVRVGRLIRFSLHAGTLSFKVSLSGKARQVLRARRRLVLSVRISLTPPHGSAVRITRSVVLHA